MERVRKNKDMEEGVIYRDPVFIEWLKSVLNAEHADMFLLYGLEARNQELLCCHVTFSTGTHRRIPIEKTRGFLNFDKTSSSLVAQELLSFFTDSTKEQRFTSAGIINYLLMIDCIGTFSTEQYELSRNVCARIPETTFKGVIQEGVKLFNKNYKVDHSSNTIVASVKHWQDLFVKLDYLEPFDDPIGVMQVLFGAAPLKVNILEAMSDMKPDSRAAVVHHGFDWSVIREKDLVRHLKNKPGDLNFFAAVVIDQSGGRLDTGFSALMGADAVKVLVTRDWLNVGRLLFRAFYAGSRKKINSEISQRLEAELDKYLIGELEKENRSTDDLIKTLVWPTDFIAFGGWLLKLRSIDVKPGGIWLEDLCDELVKLFRMTRREFKGYVNESKHVYSEWPQDPFDLKVISLYTYLHWAIRSDTEAHWKSVKKEFTSLCHELKVHYYASFNSAHLALQISNCLLCILLSYPEESDDEVPDFSRISIHLDSFVDILGLPWVVMMERDSMVWDKANREPSFSDMDVLYILRRLSAAPASYKQHIERFKNQIKERATIDWPFDVKVEDERL